MKTDYESICMLVREPTRGLLKAAVLFDRNPAVAYESKLTNSGVAYEPTPGQNYRSNKK